MLRGLVVTLLAGFLSATPLALGSGTALAAPVPCTQTISGSADTIPAAPGGGDPSDKQFRLDAPDGSDVADVDVTYNLQHTDRSDLRVFLEHRSRSVVLQPRSGERGVNNPRPLTFDDEALADFTATSGPGTYRPNQALAAFDGTNSPGGWFLRVQNWQGRESPLRGWSITITYKVCDSDGDGVNEAKDNCPTVVNAGQDDADLDGLGNECDPDIDADGVPNESDNCIIAANVGQADTDGDGAGDECDGDRDGDGITSPDNCPGVANVNQANHDRDALGDACDLDDDGDGVSDSDDRCALAAGPAKGCPKARRSVTVKTVKGALAGRVKSKAPRCRARQQVRVMRVKPGKDQLVATKRTKKSGKFRARLGRRHGRFYVVVKRSRPGNQVACGKARSRKIRR